MTDAQLMDNYLRAQRALVLAIPRVITVPIDELRRLKDIRDAAWDRLSPEQQQSLPSPYNWSMRSTMDNRIRNVGDYLTIHAIVDELLRMPRIDTNDLSHQWLDDYRVELVRWMYDNLNAEERDLIWNITTPVTQRCP